MKLLELHILQSFPVSCLNRGEDGTPKTAIFGGVPRARISSQSLKRAIRLHAKDALPELHQGVRTRYLVPAFTQALELEKVDPAKAAVLARHIAVFFNKIDLEDPRRVKTAIFLSPQEIADIAKALAPLQHSKELQDLESDPDATPNGEGKPSAKKGAAIKAEIKKACHAASRMDAADIALFGRMVATDHTVSVEGAAMFNHALSTHRAEIELDFFSAVDEAKPQDVPAGAAITETLAFTSATYYRYANLNLDMLADPAHLGGLSLADRKRVVEAFIRATLQAVPGARKTSMNAHTTPDYVVGLVRDNAHPIQLINAFESPVIADNGLMSPSIAALVEYRKNQEAMWDITALTTVTMPGQSLTELCKELVHHVI